MVLAMLGLLTSIAVPSLGKLLERMRYRSDREGVLAQINALSYRTYLLAQDYTLQNDTHGSKLKDDHPAIDLPAGWELKILQPIHFSFNGYCSGGRVLLSAPESAPETIRLAPPICEVGGE